MWQPMIGNRVHTLVLAEVTVGKNVSLPANLERPFRERYTPIRQNFRQHLDPLQIAFAHHYPAQLVPPKLYARRPDLTFLSGGNMTLLRFWGTFVDFPAGVLGRKTEVALVTSASC